MAFKFIMLSALLTIASAGYLTPAPSTHTVASTHQNVVRSFGGRDSHYSKAVHTPVANFKKEDTRINNKLYTPAIVKTVNYAAPVTKSVTYATDATASTVYNKHAVPMETKAVYTNQEPTHLVYGLLAPHDKRQQIYAFPTHTAVTYDQQHSVPSTASAAYNHGPAVTSYTHNTPAISAYGSTQTIHYSPAEKVSHMSFDGFGTHWGF